MINIIWLFLIIYILALSYLITNILITNIFILMHLLKRASQVRTFKLKRMINSKLGKAEKLQEEGRELVEKYNLNEE